MLEIDNVSCRINKRTILDNINLHVEAGDFWLLFGPNGAGKTTLLKILCGLISDFQGTVYIGKKDTRKLSRKEMARLLSYQPQFEEFSLPMSTREVLLAGRYPYKSFFRDYSTDDHHITTEAIRRFQLEDFVNRDINSLSGGERKKVMLASAIIQDVSLILFDEPFTFLDPEAISNLKKMMVKLQEQGKTLVVVSHNFETLFPIVNKIAALKKGKLVYAGEKIFDKEMLKETYNASFERVALHHKELIFLDD